MNLEKRVGTAKNADLAKPKRLEEDGPFTRWVEVVIGTASFPFASLACLAV
jgi:hypothetical protein